MQAGVGVVGGEQLCVLGAPDENLGTIDDVAIFNVRMEIGVRVADPTLERVEEQRQREIIVVVERVSILILDGDVSRDEGR